MVILFSNWDVYLSLPVNFLEKLLGNPPFHGRKTKQKKSRENEPKPCSLLAYKCGFPVQPCSLCICVCVCVGCHHKRTCIKNTMEMNTMVDQR